MKTYDEILENLCQEHYGMSFVECCEKIVYKGLKTIARHAAHEYTRQAVVEHLEREVPDSEIEMAACIDSTGRDINQPGEIWKRAIKWYKSKMNEKT